jgi:ATP-dependent RNA helicase SUPV3L1/SUV3
MKEKQQKKEMSRGRHVTAVLGPTNTGKTHLAVERMLGHQSGMIGLPLRLLAREIYDRVVEIKGPGAVALITGEEKIVPKHPRYYICTVEAMPRNTEVEFLAIDEVQLAGDEERGHIFSDRLLNWRGTRETMLLGAETIRPLLEQILPAANFITRPRFSQLSYGGQKKITRLARRAAIVAFSSEAVYTIAEFIRRQRGGAAVVMGALSPRTRNAQVGLYQSGEVDFLVATDAIGMGLNMDVGHVAFAATRKFDGSRNRDLMPAELAQIAGRAGRHMNDGTFGVTGDASPLGADVVQQIENHRFDPLKRLQWRSTSLDYSSLASLNRCLAQLPELPGFTKARAAGDVLALEALTREGAIVDMATSPEAIDKLWQVCQIPDYRNTTSNDHASLLGSVFKFLMSDSAVIPEDWLQQQLDYADKTEGDIDTLATRIAHIRTWTFVANRSDWLDNGDVWRENTRVIEERLSDALHDKLTQRFIDRRTSVLMRRLREKDDLMAEINTAGEILVEGEFVGRLEGFRFIADTHAGGAQAKALRAASIKATAEKIAEKALEFSKAADEHISIDGVGKVSWQGQIIARLQAGATILKPDIDIIADEQLSGAERERVQDRLTKFVNSQIEKHLEPLVNLSNATDIEGLGRGIAFRLCEELGVLSREDVAADIKLLDQNLRKQLRKYGVRFGAYHVFCPALLKPAAAKWTMLLWALNQARQNQISLDDIPQPPQQGLTSVAADDTIPAGFYQSVGFRLCGKRAVRIDMLERVADMIRVLIFWKPETEGVTRPAGSIEGGGFAITADMMSLVGCSGEDFATILQTLGYRMEQRTITAPVASVPPVEATEDPTSSNNDCVAPGDTPLPLKLDEQKTVLDIWLPKRSAKHTPNRSKPPGKGRDKRTSHGNQNKRPSHKQPVNKRAGPQKNAPDLKDSPFAALVELKKNLEKAQTKNTPKS